MTPKKIALILMANLMFSLGTAYFLVPSGMISGGVTGLALGLDRGFGIPKDITVWVLQVVLFLLGLWLVGKTFALTTLIGSFVYPLLFSLFTRLADRTGPLTDDPENLRPYFRSTRELFDHLNTKYGFEGEPTLSMGMSDSFRVAIEEGSTLVRVGSRIFKK